MRWDFLELLHLRQRIESFGLSLEAIENVPVHFYQHAMLGLEGRDEQIANVQETIRNLGRAGVPILGYHWMPNGVWRSSKSVRGRGEARVSVFDHDLIKAAPPMFAREYSEEEMWENWEYYISRILPVAEEFGVKLALHPDDPPVESIAGVARIFRGIEAFERALEFTNSPNHGLDFCTGTWSEMGVDTMFEAMRRFGERGKLLYIHFRNIRGCVPRFEETFIDEGDVDVVKALLILKEVGFDGFLNDDHVPQVVNDSTWRHRSRAYATGYISGLMRAVDALAS